MPNAIKPSSDQEWPTFFRSHKPGAAVLTRHALSGYVTNRDFKAAAVDYTRRALRSGMPGPKKEPAAVPSRQEREAAAWIILSEPADAWQTISEAALLAPLQVPIGFLPKVPFRQWVHETFYGEYEDEKKQFARDVGLNLTQHIADLETFFGATAAFARAPVLRDIHADPGAWPGVQIDPGLLQRLRRDQTMLMAVVRARMLGEYLRRRVTDPLRERARSAPPKWQWQSTVCIEGLVEPAVNLTKLMTVKISEKADPFTALTTAVSTGRLHLDPVLWALAIEIQQELSLDLFLLPNREAAQTISSSVVRDVAPLARLNAKQVRDSFRKDDAVTRDIGISAPVAISVLAIQLALLDAQLAGSHSRGIPKSLPQGVRSKIMRITTVLKAMSGACREIGNAQPHTDNKAGTKLLNKTLLEIAKPGVAIRLEDLSIHSGSSDAG